MKISKAEHLGGYRIRLTFGDGTEGIRDFSGLAGKGVFSIWCDPAKFAEFKIGTCGELKWGDEVDICPDSLYMQITGKKPEDVFPALKEELCHA